MPHRSAAGLDSKIIPAGFNAPLEFLTGFTPSKNYKNLLSTFSGEKTNIREGGVEAIKFC
jgi:hypothetical protein